MTTHKGETTHARRGLDLGRVSPRAVVGAVLAVLAIWFVFVNTRSVRIHFWIGWAAAPLWFVLVVTFAAGAVTALLFKRRRR
ncbi:hypothetical protein OK074_6328 [Actinobacteria bacterium OK074]|nr:hypothetical protein OK074_6328 [Actinobacteria bacterium OK074]